MLCVLSCFSCVWLFVKLQTIAYSLPDSSVHRILQARILEWFAMLASRGSSWPRNWTHVSCVSPGEGNGNPLQYSCLENPMDGGAWWAAVHGVAKSQTRPNNFTFTFHFHASEEEMATHSSVLAWRIPGTAGPGGLPSMGSHRVGHEWSDFAAAAPVSPAMAGGFFTTSTIWEAHVYAISNSQIKHVWYGNNYIRSVVTTQPQIWSIVVNKNPAIIYHSVCAIVAQKYKGCNLRQF